ncbi:MAG TPA: hypothetical protein VHL53_00950 [Acidimicrobiia bacterium]|nr:hypothetical protein [Acidimicrobiia bacterium]
MTGVVGWLFRDRRTGRITIAQWPNVPLGLWIAALAALRLADPTGGARTALGLVATGALAWWALDEIGRGVNPWRRFLGAAVLAGQVAHWLG